MNTNDSRFNHVFLTEAFCCAILMIIQGGNPKAAFVYTFQARRITNALYALGFSPEDVRRELDLAQSGMQE